MAEVLVFDTEAIEMVRALGRKIAALERAQGMPFRNEVFRLSVTDIEGVVSTFLFEEKVVKAHVVPEDYKANA